MIDNVDETHFYKITDLIEELIEFYNENDWLVVKKYVLRYSHPDVRRHFSTRHDKTKKHTLNEFEKSLINYCSNTYDIHLKLKEEDTHHE